MAWRCNKEQNIDFSVYISCNLVIFKESIPEVREFINALDFAPTKTYTYIHNFILIAFTSIVFTHLGFSS